MKKSWPIKKLGEVCSIIGGGTPSKANLNYYGGDIYWATIRDMKGEVISSTEHLITDLAVKQSSTNVLTKGNIIIATRVGLGKVCILGVDSAINQDLKGVTPKNPKALSIMFLYYWFKTVSSRIVKAGTGATVQGVTLPFINSLEIPIPQLAEQENIVAILDEAFAAIDQAKENLKKNIQNAKDLFQSELNAVFSQKGPEWTENTVGKYCKTGSGGTPLKANKNYYVNGSIPWLLSGEISQGDILNAKGFITELGLKNSSAKLFPPNTVLVAMYGATAGQMGILRFDACTNQAVCGILPNSEFLPEFLFYNLLFKKKSLLSLATGNAQPNISQIKIKDTNIFKPPIDIQKKVVLRLDNILKESKDFQLKSIAKIEKLNSLRKSILNKAFSGELTASQVKTAP